MFRIGMSAAGLLAVLSMPATSAQAPVTGQSFDVNEGLWDFTLTVHAISQLPPGTLNQFTPQQRAQVLASLKAAQAKGQVKKQSLCLSRAQLDNAAFLVNPGNCTHRLVVGGQTIVRHSVCGATTIEARMQRLDSENFKGYENSDLHDANAAQMNIDVAAKWAGAACGDINRQRVYEAGIAAGVDKDVLSFLPYMRPGADGMVNLRNFGPHFEYTYQPGANWPTIGYMGGIPGAPRGQAPDIWFAGTDGVYLYVNIPDGGSPCAPSSTNIRLDRSGNAARIDKIPLKLHGGRGAPCG